MSYYDTDNWGPATSDAVDYISSRPVLLTRCLGLDDVDLAAEVKLWVEGHNDTLIDWYYVDWYEVERYLNRDEPESEAPPEVKTFVDIAAELLSQGLATAEAASQLVEVHQDSIEAILSTLEDMETRMARMKRQINSLVEAHGS